MSAVNRPVHGQDARSRMSETLIQSGHAVDGWAAAIAAPALVPVDQLGIAMVIEKYPPFVGGAERQAQMLAGFVSSRVDTCDVLTAQRSSQVPADAPPPRRLGTARRGKSRHAINFASALSYFLARG